MKDKIERLLRQEERAGSRPCRALTLRGKVRWLLTHRARHSLPPSPPSPPSKSDVAWYLWRRRKPRSQPPPPIPPSRLPPRWHAVPIPDAEALFQAHNDIAPRIRNFHGGTIPTTHKSWVNRSPGYIRQRSRHSIHYLSYALVPPSGRSIWLIRHGLPTLHIPAPPGHVWTVDDIGLALLRTSDKTEYHPQDGSELRNPALLTDRIQKAAEKRSRTIHLSKTLRQGFVTAQHFREAGACELGIRRGAEKITHILQSQGATVCGDLVNDSVAVSLSLVHSLYPDWARRFGHSPEDTR